MLGFKPNGSYIRRGYIESIVVLFLLTSVTPSYSAAAGSSSSTAAITAAGDTIKSGDRLGLKAEATIFMPVESTDSTKKYCAPPGTIFRVDTVEAPTTTIKGSKDDKTVEPTVSTDPKNGTTTTKLAGATSVEQTQTDTTLYVHIKYIGKGSFLGSVSPFGIYPNEAPCLKQPETGAAVIAKLQSKINRDPDSASKTTDSNAKDEYIDDNSKEQVVVGTEYKVSVTELGHYGTYRNGWTWGALAIPYKYELSDHSFQARPSAATYVGYETWGPGFNVASILAIGIGASSQSSNGSSANGNAATNSSVTSGVNRASSTGGTTSGTTSTNSGGSQALYTAGVGFIFTLGGSFKGGLLVGKDWAGHSTGFGYEGRTWLAITLGAGF
jgi:hypothetical protein